MALVKDLFSEEQRAHMREVAAAAFKIKHERGGGDGEELLPSASGDTPAMLAMKRRDGLEGEHLQPVNLIREDADTISLAVRRISSRQHKQIGGVLARAGYSLEDLDLEDAQAVWDQALLYVCCVKSEQDQSPYFQSLNEVAAWQDDPAMTEEVDAIMGVILAMNPRLFVGDKNAKKKVQVQLG